MRTARPAAVIILAAGEGTRMRSGTHKVLHAVGGRSMLGHVVHLAAALEPDNIVVVVGHHREHVTDHLFSVIAPELPDELGQRVTTAHQVEQLGTGHAVKAAMAELADVADSETVIVLNGDTPLLRADTLRELHAAHASRGAAATVGGAVAPEPRGLGRIVRGEADELVAIVEERDATDEQRTITEINTGVFAFTAGALRRTLPRLAADNDQKQEYLTDVISLLRVEPAASPSAVGVHTIADYRESLGCNDRTELAALGAILRDRVADKWMRAGVTMTDPTSVWIDVTVTLDRDVTIAPNVQLHGTTSVGAGARIGPDTTLIDAVVGPESSVIRSHCESAQIGPRATVGPFAYLRPGSALAEDAKVGAYVEVKNSELGAGAKVPHLSYIGDATIGEGSNIGASSVVVNYDGVSKHRTTIGRHCRTGSNTLFVAPVTVGDGAYTAAGSTITSDVPPGALAVARAQQRNIAGWVFRRRAGTAAAIAAAAALEETQDGGSSVGNPASDDAP